MPNQTTEHPQSTDDSHLASPNMVAQRDFLKDFFRRDIPTTAHDHPVIRSIDERLRPHFENTLRTVPHKNRFYRSTAIHLARRHLADSLTPGVIEHCGVCSVTPSDWAVALAMKRVYDLNQTTESYDPLTQEQMAKAVSDHNIVFETDITRGLDGFFARVDLPSEQMWWMMRETNTIKKVAKAYQTAIAGLEAHFIVTDDRFAAACEASGAKLTAAPPPPQPPAAPEPIVIKLAAPALPRPRPMPAPKPQPDAASPMQILLRRTQWLQFLVILLASSLMPPGVISLTNETWPYLNLYNPINGKPPLIQHAIQISPTANTAPMPLDSRREVLLVQNDTTHTLAMIDLRDQKSAPFTFPNDGQALPGAPEFATLSAPKNAAYLPRQHILAFTMRDPFGRQSLWTMELRLDADDWPVAKPGTLGEILADCGGCRDLAWAPSGVALFYATDQGIAMVNLYARQVTWVIQHPTGGFPMCAPDGTTFSYVRLIDLNIVVLPARDCVPAQGAIISARLVEGYGSAWGEVWSSDSVMLAFASTVADGKPTIYLANRADFASASAFGTRIPVARLSGQLPCYDPAWIDNPNGASAEVAFTCERGGNAGYALEYVSVADPTQCKIADLPAGDRLFHPIWLAWVTAASEGDGAISPAA